MGKRIACICGKPGRVQHTRMKFLRDNYLPYLDVYAGDVPDLSKYEVVYFSHYSLAKKVKFDGKRKMLASVTSHKYDKKELGKFDRISVNNRILLNELAEFSPVLTENGVDTKFWTYRPNTQDYFEARWVGNNDRGAKRYDVWAKLKKEMSRYGWFFDEVATSKHGKQTHTPEQMRSGYHISKVLIVTSESEGTPNPALEAMSCGCWVIAPPIGNLRDIPYRIEVSHNAGWREYENYLAKLADGWYPGYTRYDARKCMELQWDWSIKYKAWDNFFKEWL